MPRWDALGRRVMVLRPPGLRPYRPTQWAAARERWYVLLGRVRQWHALWHPGAGHIVYGSAPAGSLAADTVYLDPRQDWWQMKRRSVQSGSAAVSPALSAESKVLKGMPSLCEFLSATVYDDGTARTPGYMWISNRRTAYEITLFDPDACCKLPVIGKTLDDVYAAAEALLRAEEAPWQHDEYLAERQAKSKKKRAS